MSLDVNKYYYLLVVEKYCFRKALKIYRKHFCQCRNKNCEKKCVKLSKLKTRASIYENR